jgi:hypothetical protein
MPKDADDVRIFSFCTSLLFLFIFISCLFLTAWTLCAAGRFLQREKDVARIGS